MTANQTRARVVTNRRGIEETIFDHEHLTLKELCDRLTSEGKVHRYLYNNIPPYPRPELHVTHLSHSTNLSSLFSIQGYGGFRDLYSNKRDPKVVWFSLTVSPKDLRHAETRDMKIVNPVFIEEDYGRITDRAEGQRGILEKFASSPAFLPSSRYGSYRFTFTLKDVLDKYSKQFCAGEKPVMRKWKTVLYKQEVMYVVLVHRPTIKRFSKLPLLTSNQEADPICEFREDPEPHFIWRPQAMCNTHSFQLNPDGTLETAPDSYYVWDHVAIALLVHDGILEFEDIELRENLRYCKKGDPSMEEFEDHQQAKTEVNNLWPLEGFEKLDRFDESMFAVASDSSNHLLGSY